MVSDLFRGAVVVILAMALIFAAVVVLAPPPDAEGPYRKEPPGRCVCR